MTRGTGEQAANPLDTRGGGEQLEKPKAAKKKTAIKTVGQKKTAIKMVAKKKKR